MADDSQYPYPPDRFDDEADAASFHGAHRAEEPFWRQNLVYILIIGAAFLTLLVLLFFINGLGGDGEEGTTGPVASSAEASDGGDGGEGAEEGGEETTAEEEPTAEPDRSTPVLVMNAANINGLAGTWQDTLEEDGWTEVGVGTADQPQDEAAVYYRDEADAASAQALAEEVGAGEATQSDEYDNRITFIAVSEPGDSEEGDGEE